MSNSDPTPGTERRNVIFNLVMFALTGLVTLIYSWTFVEHVLRGLETSLTDELCELSLAGLWFKVASTLTRCFGFPWWLF